MRAKLGTFQYEVGLLASDGQRYETFEAWVDTGAHYSQFPASVLEAMGYQPNASRRFRLADGSVSESPVGPVGIRINDETQPVLCLFAEEGADVLLGATSLETFTLAADPVNKTLIQVEAKRLASRPDITPGSLK